MFGSALGQPKGTLKIGFSTILEAYKIRSLLQSLLSALKRSRLSDLLSALEMLQNHPEIDPTIAQKRI